MFRHSPFSGLRTLEFGKMEVISSSSERLAARIQGTRLLAQFLCVNTGGADGTGGIRERDGHESSDISVGTWSLVPPCQKITCVSCDPTDSRLMRQIGTT